MKNKAPLTMMEQVIMLLVFALAAALCLQAFAAANTKSKTAAARDRAATQAQNAAEVLKHSSGDYEHAADLLGGICTEDQLTVSYDADWNVSDAPGIVYQLSVTTVETDLSLLGQAEIAVTNADGELLFSLPVSWQKGGSQ